jgi:hypothetical protein
MTTRTTCGKLAVNFMGRKVATDASLVNAHFCALKIKACPSEFDPHSGRKAVVCCPNFSCD